MLRTSLPLALAAALAAGCGDNQAAPAFPTNDCSQVTSGSCVEITGGDSATLQTQTNSIGANTTIILGVGTFKLSNQITIRTAGAHLIGQGIDTTTLDFGPTETQANGVDVQGDNFLIQDLTVIDAKKDGIRVEASNGVVYRRIRVTSTNPSATTNGAYGIYPVKSQNVLVEDSVAENASDAGLYVGQCQHVIVRNNRVTGNVAGLEIENTEYADVYGNTAEDNTGGIVVFDLPGNPIIGRDVRLRDNTIRNNNHVNFGTPGTTVASIPVGTGTFAMASRRVEITGNTYENNDTGDIALISGLAIEQDVTKWVLPTATLAGTYADLGLLSAAPGTVMNFRSENILVANNHHTGSGQHPDPRDPLQLGLLLLLSYGNKPVDSVLYDAIGEQSFHSTDAAMNSNTNHMCVGGNTGGTFASMALDKQSATATVAFFRPAAPFKPFDCTMLAGGPVAPVVLP
ncbi:MAG TPA: parallel beta-helix domain-containing protein [Kofleriaceae bacterium]|nr:parallel beta-helix domain-containing protein [Kofleriaceae bacterium]